MSAQVHFGRGRKPTEMVAIAGGYEISGFGEVIFLLAIDCSVASGSHFSNGQMAAGLPPKTLLGNASTWKMESSIHLV